ncbi:MAG: metal-sulfur cluster assembly factor [Actinomycetota bacterium]
MPTEEQVAESLKVVNDPELGINIVDLGLVYDIQVTEDGEVHIVFTLTSAGCPIGPMLEQEIKQVLGQVEGVAQVTTDLVLSPPWGPEKMSDLAKSALGFF